MKGDLLQATNTKRSKAVIVLQATELTLNGGAATIEVAEPLAVSWDARE